jgi:histidinol-phosphate/aromatic aminotransferase/cobyric acid decarboxylase-like protein
MLGGLCHPGRTMLAPEPGFVMYGVSARWPGWIMWACHCVRT